MNSEQRLCPLLDNAEIDEDNCFENCLIAESCLNTEFYPQTKLPKDKAKEICLACKYHED